jgi:molybdenum-dependent DNA-binding transcriptional regulator ModE
MQTNQVRYFFALCEERSFTRAAKRCGVSQPSLTNAIKRLEQALGGPLFHRERGKIGLTELGLVVKPYLTQLDKNAYEAKRKAETFLSTPSITHQPRAMEASMRAHHLMAVIIVFIIGLGAKEFLFPPIKADADVRPSAGLNVLQMQRDLDMKRLPVQSLHDLTFVFDSE